MSSNNTDILQIGVVKLRKYRFRKFAPYSRPDASAVGSISEESKTAITTPSEIERLSGVTPLVLTS
jgi:hypothetical protein